MGILLTEEAAKEVKRIIEEQKLEEGTLLRVGVAGGGCGGFAYSLGFDKQYDAKVDSKSQMHEVDVVVDKKSALLLDGTTIGFHSGNDRSGFTFDNPNAMQSCCGCGGG